MKAIVKVLSTVLFLLISGTNLQAEEVVTIYFGGTGTTEDWWDADNTTDGCGLGEMLRPEGISTLHHAQLNPDEPNAPSNHHKFFVDGICTGCPAWYDCISKLQACAFASSPWDETCRGWTTCLNEAEDFLKSVLDQASCSVILNLVGHSRGGILTFMFSDLVNEWPTEDKNRIAQINILALDPVAGETSPPAFFLNGKVENYVGIYATDERSFMFSPSIPDLESSVNSWIFRVPGSHETLGGNTQTDGHATYQTAHWFTLIGCPWPSIPIIPETSSCCAWMGRCFNDNELKKVSNVVNTIAVELLGSPQWGNVKFKSDRLVDNWNGEVYDESAFIDAVNTMWDYDYYRTMRLISSTVFMFECYTPDAIIIADILDWQAFGLYDNDRVSTTSYLTIELEPSWYYTSLEQEVDALDNGSDAWTELQDLVNTPNPALLPIPDVDPLPIVEGQCSAEVSVIPTATGNCLETILGTTDDPLFYDEQGEYTITWTYDDGNGNTVDQTQTVVVQDTTPPDINLSLSPDVLWPPNHKMVEVVPTIEVDDACCASDITVALVSITIDEADTGRPLRRWLRRRGDIRIVNGRIYLRAERAGNSDGRTYTITYQATDCNGNTATASADVIVPHDMRR